MSDSQRGFELDTGFTDHFNTQLIITLNYGAIADLHTFTNHCYTYAGVLALSIDDSWYGF
jgi:hypothetical protein